MIWELLHYLFDYQSSAKEWCDQGTRFQGKKVIMNCRKIVESNILIMTYYKKNAKTYRRPSVCCQREAEGSSLVENNDLIRF